MNDIEMLRDTIDSLRHEIREDSLHLARYIKEHSDDPIAYGWADRILTCRSLERRLRLMLVNEELVV